MKFHTLTLIVCCTFQFCFSSGKAQKLNDMYSFKRQINGTSFIENLGQWDKAAQFGICYPNMNAWITPTGFVFDVHTSGDNKRNAPLSTLPSTNEPISINEEEVRGNVFSMEFTGGALAKTVGKHKQEGVYHYILGNKPSEWIHDVHLFEEVRIYELYKGVNMRVYSAKNQFRYDLLCDSTSKPSKIHFRFEGAANVELSPDGNIVLGSSIGEVFMGAPNAYQIINGKKILVECKYYITSDKSIGFETGKYDVKQELIIDPPVFSNIVGGSDSDNGVAITVDTNKSAYITGETSSMNFPVIPGSYKTTLKLQSCFVSKYRPSGTSMLYSTFLGGDTFGASHGTGIACDASGICYVSGYTSSKDFPTTDGSLHHNADAGFDVFVVKLNPQGSGLLYSTLIGGRSNDYSNSLSVNSAGEVFFGGSTDQYNRINDYPITGNAFAKVFNGGSNDGFVTKLDNTGKVAYSTLIGGNGDDYIRGITVDINGSAYITGETNSPGATFPTTPFVLMKTLKGGYDCFVAKLSINGDSLLYSTLIGDVNQDHGYGIAVDFIGNVYVAGVTSSPKFPVTATPLAFDTLFNGGDDCFILKLNTTGSRFEYSTFLGGKSNDYCTGIAIDACGAAYVTGYTSSVDFPTTRNGIDSVHHGLSFDNFITKANSTGSVITYSTLIGGALDDKSNGIFVDSTGAAYITGFTQSTDYPTSSGSAFAGNQDAIITKIQVGILPLSPRIISDGPLSFCGGGSVTLEAEDKFYKTYQWFLNDSAIIGAIIPRITAKDSGIYRLDVTDASGCIGTGNVHVNVRPVPSLDAGNDIQMCPDSTAQFAISVKDSIVKYRWVPNLGLSSDTIANPTAKPPVTVMYFVTITDSNGCINSDSVTIIVLTPDMITLGQQTDTLIICPKDSLLTSIAVHNAATVPQKLKIMSNSKEFRILTDTSMVSAEDSSFFPIRFTGSTIDSVYSGLFTIIDQCGNIHTATLNIRVGEPLISPAPAQDITICQFDTVTKYLTINNQNEVTATLAISGGGGKFLITPATVIIPGNDSATVGVFFAGDIAGTYSTKLFWTDQCGKKDSVSSQIIVESIPLKVTLSSSGTNLEKIGVERFVDILLDSLDVINQSSTKEITLTVQHEQTSIVFDSVIALQCESMVTKLADKTIIKLLNCGLNLKNPIATLRYSTVVGSTLTPIVKLTNVTTGDRCITPTSLGTDTLRLLAYGCEIKTLNVQLFTSALRSYFPNPASSTTTVEYATIEEVPVKISLMNTLGQSVKTIMDITHKPGVYQTTFSVTDIPDGLYFLVMEAGAYRDAKSILISQGGRQ
ncbi:MAG: SBBP repeat-containing protein [Bacteroidetes bacterium]|nr:SBBP repeat-containing protein [Bacteroidota bacterium]